MYARVWRANILPGKAEEFAAAMNSIRPVLHQMPGFCGLIVLRSGPGEALETTVVSAWASIEDLRNSETPAFQEAAAHVMAYCERHPVMREEEVVVSDFSASNLDDTVTRF
jgi:heme-degrading monooxygenase HmoA